MSRGLELKPPSTPPSIDDWDDEEGAIQAMVEWFRANFEDPAMETPYESAEGGYQYIWGGPYDATEELYDAFPDASDELIERAADEIQSDGLFDWAPAGNRIREEDEPDDPDEQIDRSLAERLRELEAQIDKIEEHIAYWRSLDPQIGHNQPPDEFRLDANDADLIAAAESVAEVRVELAKGNRENTADVAVINRAEGNFRRLAAKIWNWTKKTGGALGLGIVAGVGKVIGENVAGDPHAFMKILNEAAINLSHWAIHIVSFA